MHWTLEQIADGERVMWERAATKAARHHWPIPPKPASMIAAELAAAITPPPANVFYGVGPGDDALLVRAPGPKRSRGQRKRAL